MITQRDTRTGADERHLLSRPRWPLIGALGGALGAIGPLLGIAPVSEGAAESGGAAILAEIQKDRLPIAVGAVAGMAAVVCLVIFAAGLRRRLQHQEPAGSTAADVAVAGLALTAGALLVGLAATYQLWWNAGGMYDGPDLVAAAFAVADTVPFAAWTGVGLAAGATAVAGLRHAAVPRWLGWFSAATAFVIGAMSVGMVPFMAFMPGGLWLLVAGVGLDRRPQRPAPA